MLTPIFLLGIVAASPAGEERFDEAWRWVQFTTESGLPSNRILDLVETDDSVVWALTTSGLAWFDGFQWNTVDSSYGLPGRQVNSVARFNATQLLIFYDEKVYLGNQSGFSEIPIEKASGMAPLPPYGLIVEKNSSLFMYDKRKLSPFTVTEESTKGKTIWLRATRGGSVWAHLADGFYRFEKDGWKRKIPFGPLPGVIASVAENEHGTGIAFLTFPLAQRGLWEWFRASAPVLNTTERPDNVRWLDVGKDDEAVVLYQSGDIKLRENGVWSELAVPSAVIQDINLVQIRNNRDLWFGTDHGLFLYRRSSSRWTILKHPSPDLRNSINELIKTRDGSLWVGTSDGLEIYHPDHSVEMVTRIDSTSLYVVTGLLEDRSGNVWISSGSSFTGTFCWDGNRWTHYNVSTDREGIYIHKIRQDRHGRLWFLGMSKVSPTVVRKEPGAYLYAKGKFFAWGVEEGLLSGRVYAFAEAGDGSLWFGTSAALSRWKPRPGTDTSLPASSPTEGTWTHWTLSRGLRDNKAFALTIDHENHIWFGDHGGAGTGLGTIDANDSIHYLTTADGLVNDNIWDLSVDHDGTLWISTEGGLSSYRNGHWSTFDAQSGLLHTTLWPVLPDSHVVYVGTQGRGVAILNREESKTPVPRVRIDIPGMEGENIFLRWSAFAYWGELDPSEILTRYRLNSGPWSAWSKQKEVTVSGLQPGQYTCLVQGKGLFGEYAEAGVVGSFSIPEPMYLRPVFYLPTGILAGAVIVLGVVLLVRKRKHDIALRRSEEKFRTVTETSSSAIFIHKDFQLVFANSGAEHLTGYVTSELLQMSYLDLVHLDFQRMIESQCAVQPMPSSKTERSEVKIRKKDGEERWIDCTTGSIQIQGKPYRLVTAFDITERKHAEEKLRSLASELSLTEERERRRMASYLHDVIGQTLAIIKMKIRRIQKAESPDALSGSLEEIREMVEQSILNTQTLTFDLCPPILYELSFEAAIEWLTERMQSQHGLCIRFEDDRQVKNLAEDVRILLFLAVREVLVNVVKHADAQNVLVALARQDGMISISIQDDGAGFEVLDDRTIIRKEGGFGLFNIRERLTHIGGRLEIVSQTGKGTKVLILAPLNGEHGSK